MRPYVPYLISSVSLVFWYALQPDLSDLFEQRHHFKWEIHHTFKQEKYQGVKITLFTVTDKSFFFFTMQAIV